MSNKYGIQEKDEIVIRTRDKVCVYCHKKLVEPNSDNKRTDWATVEHLNHLPPWNNPLTVAICCFSCNASRGNRRISDWFKGEYCLERNINEKTVAKPVREYLYLIENFIDILSWTFAKTMPEIPHYYVVRDNLPEEDKKGFDFFGEYIKEKGYPDTFDSQKYTYLKLGNYKYWVIDNVLNRAQI
jgi:hypothetical protein